MLITNFDPFPEIVTKRLLLRKLTLEDAKGVFELRSDKEVMRYINRPLTKTMEDAIEWVNKVINNLDANEGITWCICLKDNPQVHVGSIGLWRIEKENYRAEIGYMLHPGLQGKGIMYEAIVEVLQYGFKQMGLHSVEAHIDPRNTASAALLKKAQFIQEAYFRENCYSDEGFTDTAVFSILNPIRTNH